MDELLSRALEAHGGLGKWAGLSGLTAEMSLGGPFWKGRGWPDVYKRTTVEIDSHREHITFTPFTAPDRRSVLDVDPERVLIETVTGQAVDDRREPRASFPSFDPATTPWDALQVAYFTSYAVWNYLTTPYLLTYPEVEAHEIEPWQEGGQTWRRLQVKFPRSIATHNAEQIFYFGSDHLLRRLDYQPEVTGAPIAHYVNDPREFDGFVFPTRRRVYSRQADGTADQSLAYITLDIDRVTVRRRK